MQAATTSELPQSIEQAHASIINLRGHNEHLKEEVDYLKRLIRLLKHQKFAKSSEKISASQPNLFDEAEGVVCEEVSAAEAVAAAAVETTTLVPAHERRLPRREALPAELPRVDNLVDLAEADKVCGVDGTTLEKIGEETSEQLEYIPAQFRVIRTIRPKYACKTCSGNIKIAPLPKTAIPRSIASASLLAQVAVAKYADALPLYRQEQIFSRAGIAISRQSMAEWMIRVGGVLTPIINLCKEKLLESAVINADETPVQVLKEKDKPPDSKSYMWVACRKEKGSQIVLYHYAPSRSGAVPAELFAGYKGYLHIDGYDGYNKVCGEGKATRVGCWAHVRRKFMDALKSLPKGVKDAYAEAGLGFIKELYRIEAESKDLGLEELLAVRQLTSQPVIETIRAWLDEALVAVVPKSLTGVALNYLHNEWRYLTHFLGEPRLRLDNNTAENAVRPFVIGRKNWLFCDTAAGAEASAAIYSVIVTAKANGVDPYLYLRHVLTELPKAETLEQIEDLLPWRYRATLLN